MKILTNTRYDIYSVINNLETMLNEGKIVDIHQGQQHLRTAKVIHEWIEKNEKVWAEIEMYTDTRSYEADLANRRKLNILDIKPNDSKLDMRKTYLINSIRRMQIKLRVRMPLTELSISPNGGYYKIMQVMANGKVMFELSITYPPAAFSKLEITISNNHHPISEPLYLIHTELERYLVELIEASNLEGVSRDDAYIQLNNIFDKITDAVTIA